MHFHQPSVLVFAALLAGLSTAQAAPRSTKPTDHMSPKVIYGSDSRRDLYDEANPIVRELADSTVALIQRSSMTTVGDRVTLQGQRYGDAYNLCTDEPFRDQDQAAFCSGFLVGPNHVVTAGHCVSSQSDCSDTAFVFGFAYRAPGTPPTDVPASEVYGCQKIVHTQALGLGADFAVIELDRPVTDHKPLKLREQGSVRVGDKLVVIGHPSGLPLKIADGAEVRSTARTGYFIANLDTFAGNSGSAVFNAKTFEIEGILVRGERDFKSTPAGCNVSYTCADSGCRGEDVTRISEALPYLPR